jgi:hypothetical protein
MTNQAILNIYNNGFIFTGKSKQFKYAVKQFKQEDITVKQFLLNRKKNLK